jgi:trans-2,3-dihydro-3-hydroxyanthranilate isomerase
MTARKFRILNVFAIEGAAFSGNPLCVVENCEGLTDAEMQAIALQFNLSETTFILPSTKATARIRIFMPHVELPFGGHPTLGSASVVHDLLSTGDKITLETKFGVIALSATGDQWELTAPSAKTRSVNISSEQLAAMLGLSTADIGAPALWVNTGVEQLLVPLNSVGAVRRCQPMPSLLGQSTRNQDGVVMVYVWAADGARQFTARFFFEKGNALCEDPATGSACANLGGWLLAENAAIPASVTIDQGAETGRRCRLNLRIDATKEIKVSGLVTEFGVGEFVL